MKFPIKKYLKTEEFKNDYYKSFKTSFENIDFTNLNKITKVLDGAYTDKKKKNNGLWEWRVSSPC